jgi:type III pantothenate kinase
MILLVDIGNSRVKWARLGAGGLGQQSAASYGGWTEVDWRTALFPGDRVEQVLAASVAGPAAAAMLDAAARAATGRPARFVTTTRAAAGVLNGYADPGLLGVDRWLAVIGSYARVRGGCVVADIGTAATVDVVSRDGRHLGGYIVPGQRLMVASLLGSTGDLATRHAASGAAGSDAGFADNTREAMERGCRLALAALIDRSVVEAERSLGERCRLLVTGGGAAEVLPDLRGTAEHVPDLVLRGLAELVGTPVPTSRADPHSKV